MSSAKFASITAGLLARKGEAAPWTQETEKAPLAWRQTIAPPVGAVPPPVLAAAPPLPPPPPKERSCSIRMAPHDYERLGIIAVKTGVTRQQILKDALARYLSGQAAHFSCACLDPGACEKTCGAS